LQAQRLKQAAREEEARDVIALNVAADRLGKLIHDRRLLLAAQQAGAPQGQTPN